MQKNMRESAVWQSPRLIGSAEQHTEAKKREGRAHKGKLWDL